MKKFLAGVAMMIVVIVLLFLIAARGLLVRENVAVKTLETQGFSSVKVLHRNWFLVGFRGGHQGDAVRFVCQAVNPAGHEVTVHVFAGWPFQGATVRTP